MGLVRVFGQGTREVLVFKTALMFFISQVKRAAGLTYVKIRAMFTRKFVNNEPIVTVEIPR